MKKCLEIVLIIPLLSACVEDNNNDIVDPTNKVISNGSVSGFVTDTNSGAVIADVKVQVSDKEVITGADGVYEITKLDTGKATIIASKPGFIEYLATITINSNQNTSHDIVLSQAVVTSNKSCLDILAAGESLGDGFYTIDADGDGPLSSFEVYCNMTTEGGGWTLFANHEDDIETINKTQKVTQNENGVMNDQRWQAIRDNMTFGLLFIDENEQVSMISKSKVQNGNCKVINDTSNLAELTSYPHSLWHHEDSGCTGTGLDYTIAILAGDSYSGYSTAGASLQNSSGEKFDIWPYSKNSSYEVQDKLLYFVK